MFPSLMAVVNFFWLEFNLAFAINSISEYLLFYLVINPLVDLKIVAQDVNATEIGTLTGIIIRTAIEVPTIPNSETYQKFCSKSSIC